MNSTQHVKATGNEMLKPIARELARVGQMEQQYAHRIFQHAAAAPDCLGVVHLSHVFCGRDKWQLR
jgi:hypothetical protein